MSKNVKNLVSGISLALNLAMAIVLFSPLTEQLYKPLIVNGPLGKGEAIVILSGDCYRTGLLGFKTLTRLQKGLELYRNGLSNKIICLGGKRIAMVNKTIAEVMKEALILYGVPAKDVLVYDKMINTYNDINGLLLEHNLEFDFNKVIFVTSSFHTYRVKKILDKKRITAAVVSAEPYELYPNFWTKRLDSFSLVVREYLSICYFKIKNWI